MHMPKMVLYTYVKIGIIHTCQNWYIHIRQNWYYTHMPKLVLYTLANDCQVYQIISPFARLDAKCHGRVRRLD